MMEFRDIAYAGEEVGREWEEREVDMFITEWRDCLRMSACTG
jgi:hypothetical protein